MTSDHRIEYEDVIQSAFAGRVRRYHTWPMLQHQSVGEHSARVAMLYILLYGLPRAEVLYYCLAHDLGEMHSGDVPYHAKRHSQELKDAMNTAEARGLDMMAIKLPELTAEEWKQFKTCDLLELYEHSRVDVMMGNRLAQPCCVTVARALMNMWGADAASSLLDTIEDGLPPMKEESWK